MATIRVYLGVKGSGKNYKASQDHKRLLDAVNLDFKDELTKMTWDLIGYKPDSYEDFKLNVVGLDNKYLSAMLKFMFPKLLTGREVLQRLGTEVMRSRDPEYWVKAWTAKAARAIYEGKHVLVTDCRFVNELQAIRGLHTKNNVKVSYIFCDYKSYRYDDTDSHPSEAMSQFMSKALRQRCYKDGNDIPAEVITSLVRDFGHGKKH